MGGCAAPNCTRSTRKGYRLFEFPKEGEGRDGEKEKVGDGGGQCNVWLN